MKQSNKNQSIGNLSRDSGVDEMLDNRSNLNGHSRQASNATSCYSTDTGYNEQQHIIKSYNTSNFRNFLNNIPFISSLFKSKSSISSISSSPTVTNKKLSPSCKAKYKYLCYNNKNDLLNDNDNSYYLPCYINSKAIIILISFIISILLLLIYCHLPLILTKILQSIINIDPNGGQFFNFWIKSSEPTEVGLHFFHIENPWAFQNGLEKLKIKETGRYYFKQSFVRDINSFNNDNSIVNFTEKRYYYFDNEKTKLSLDDNITVVNVPFAALSSIVPGYLDGFAFNLLSHFSYRGVNDFLENHNQTLFINTTIRELLYGYRLNILDTAESYNSLFQKAGFEIIPRELFPNNSFGILHGRNGTPDGPYEMFTGLSNTQNKFGYIKTWKNLTKLNFWKNKYCNAINGTDGTTWPAGIKKTDRLDFFIPDICRSLYVTFQEESSYKGIPTYLFSAPDSVLAGKNTNPDNACFCIEEDDDLADSRCIDGIFDLAGCQDGIPIIVSLPHFLGADKRITQEIIGLKPEPEKHRPELQIEPKLGLVIHGDSRLQMSIRVTPHESLFGFDKLKKETYIPIFWGYKKLGMSDDMATSLQYRLYYPYKALKIITILLFVGSIIFGIYGIFKWILISEAITITTNDLESSKHKNLKQKQQIYRQNEFETIMPRVESATSDLGINNEDDDDIMDCVINVDNNNTNVNIDDDAPSITSNTIPRNIELKSLVNSNETDI